MDPNTVPTEDLSFYAQYKDVLLVLLGAVCASLGGFAGAWYRAKLAGEVKFKESLAEQKANALGKAMRLLNGLRSIRIQGVHKDVLDFIREHNEWMLDNEPVLPQKAVENWHSVRHNVRSLMRKDSRLQGSDNGPQRNLLIEEIHHDEEFTDNLVKEAEQLIRQELSLKPFKIHRRKRTTTQEGTLARLTKPIRRYLRK